MGFYWSYTLFYSSCQFLCALAASWRNYTILKVNAYSINKDFVIMNVVHDHAWKLKGRSRSEVR